MIFPSFNKIKSMKKNTLFFILPLCAIMTSLALAQGGPSVEQALSFKPTQPGVDYAQPAEEDAASCRLEQLSGDISGWKLIDKNGQTLRVFADTNGDKAMDQWRYFKEGVEVYRDIDTNGNNKPDEYRWFNMSGSRWGLDKNEDQRIESWKRISAEEATAESFYALKTGDKSRFMALLLTAEEIDALDITDAQKKQLKGLIEKAVTDFEEGVKAKVIARNAEYLQFNGDKPSAVPSDLGDGIVAFENVSSFARVNETEMQLANGTLIQIGDAWKTLFCPQVQTDAEHSIASIFLPGGAAAATVSSNVASAQKQQELIGAIEKIDAQLQQTTDLAQRSALHKQRASVVEKIAQSSVGEDRDMWYRQLADGLQLGAQLGELSDGADILAKFADKFKAEGDENLAGYFSFRELMTRYYLGMAAPNADWAEIQMKWYTGLEKFVEEYPNSPDSAEALFQLANTREMSGRESDAIKWYSQIVSKFPKSPQAAKSKGALYRLGCVGKQMQLRGETTNDKVLDIAKFVNYNVIVYYWNATSSTAQSDVLALKAAKEKFGSKLQIIGVNLDNNPQLMNQFVENNKINWYQIDGKGMDGPLACDMGIITPTMILIDASGKIVNRNLQARDLDSALRLLFAPPTKLD